MAEPKSRVDKIVWLVNKCSKILVESGGEIYRVRELSRHIYKAFDMHPADTFALTTGIISTIFIDGHYRTTISEILTRKVNLKNIYEISNISYRLNNKTMTLDQACKEVEEISCRKTPTKESALRSLFSGAASGCFTILSAGSAFDAFVATVIGSLTNFLSIKLSHMTTFMINLIGGLVAGIFATIAVHAFGMGNIDKIIIGSIIPLLPGLAVTNAVRDTINGDYMSGVARAAEAVLIAVALAVGVGTAVAAARFFGVR